MNKKILIFIGVLTSLTFIVHLLSNNLKLKNREFVNAAPTNIVFGSQSDWQAGEQVNIDTFSLSGSIKMNTKTAIRQDLGEASATSINIASGNASDTLNSSCSTSNLVVFGGSDAPGDKSFTVDLGEEKTSVFFELNFLNFGAETKFYTSSNGSTWNLISISEVEGSACSGPVAKSPSFTGRYVKVFSPADINPSCNWGSFNLFQRASSEQVTIDGGANFWSWDSNTIAQTVPENTTATYQYRTSANGTDWTSWVGDIGSVTNRTGDDSNNPN